MDTIVAGHPPEAGAYDADILILSLHRPAETEEAILSALSQTAISRHVIVLDQGSSAETLTRFTRLIDGRRDAVLISASANLGVAEGRNRAAALGHARALIALDNDAVFADSGTAARAVALLDAQPELAALGFRIMNGDGSGDDHASWGYPQALRAEAGARFACATFVGAGHAIRRTAWNALGGYDPQLFFTFEELDFALKAIARGWQLLYAGDIAVHHKLASASRVGWSEERWFLFVRNRLYIERKWQKSTPELLARAGAYALKSMRLGLMPQGARAIVAAFRMPLPPSLEPMTEEGRRYLHRTDLIWRGGLWHRWRAEIMTGLPSSRPRQPGHRAVTNQP